MKHVVWILLLAASPAVCQTLPVREIMGRVAANQAKSLEARKFFVYHQKEFISMRRANGQLDCEQRREYSVAPTPDGVERQLLNPPQSDAEKARCTIELKTDSGASFSASTGSDGDAFTVSMGKTRDGVPETLFPLTAELQRLYDYKLKGVEKYRGHDVYRIAFRPNHQKAARPGSSRHESHWRGHPAASSAHAASGTGSASRRTAAFTSPAVRMPATTDATAG